MPSWPVAWRRCVIPKRKPIPKARSWRHGHWCMAFRRSGSTTRSTLRSKRPTQWKPRCGSRRCSSKISPISQPALRRVPGLLPAPAVSRHQAANPLRARLVSQDHEAQRHQHAAADTLYHPKDDEQHDGWRYRAQQRAQHEQQDRTHEEAFGAEPIRCPPGHRDHGRKRQHVAGHRPGDDRLGESK